MTRGHASKIDEWLHPIAAKTRQYQGHKSLVLASASPSLIELSWYILFLVFLAGYSSDMSKGLDSMHLLEVPLLSLQVMRI